MCCGVYLYLCIYIKLLLQQTLSLAHRMLTRSGRGKGLGGGVVVAGVKFVCEIKISEYDFRMFLLLCVCI